MPGTSSKMVMIVDDEVDVRDGLSEFLQSMGYQTRAACNGRDALSQLRTTTRLPDAIVLDMMMPTMDGLSFRWEQLADRRLADIPVMILSASGHCQATAIELQTAGCLKKPVRPEELLEALMRICDAHE